MKMQIENILSGNENPARQFMKTGQSLKSSKLMKIVRLGLIGSKIKHVLFSALFVFAVPVFLYPADVISQKKDTKEVIFAKQIKESLAKNSIDETLKLFESKPELVQNNTDMMILQASVMLSGGKFNEVSEIVTKLEEIAPDNRDVSELSLIVAKITGNKAKLNSKVKTLLANDPNNDLANIELAEESLKLNNYKEAVSFYSKALEGNPSSEDAMLGLGQCYYYLVKPETSRKYLNMLLAKNEMNPDANLYLGKLEAEESKYRSALVYVEKAQKADPNNIDIYIDLGTYRHRLLNNKGAEEAWTKAIDLAPDFFLTYAYRASLYEEMGKYSEAYADYKKVVELNPKYYYAFESMGMLAWHEKDYEGALNAFRNALKSSPDNISYNMMIAACLSKLGQNQQMKQHLQNVMKKLNRESVEYSVARLYHDGGGFNAENSTYLLVKRESSATKRAKFLFYLGLFYELNNFGERSAKFYEDSVNASPPLFFEYRLAEWGKEWGKNNGQLEQQER